MTIDQFYEWFDNWTLTLPEDAKFEANLRLTYDIETEGLSLQEAKEDLLCMYDFMD